MSRPRSWTDDDLRRAIAVSTSWSDVARALGLHPSGHTHRLLRQKAWRLGLLTSHFTSSGGVVKPPVPLVVEGTAAQRRQGNRRRWSDEQLTEAVRTACSWAGVHRNLGITIGGTTYQMLQRRSRELGLDTAHFTGMGWRKGNREPPPGVRVPIVEILVAESTYVSSNGLRRRLIQEGLKQPRCEGCGGAEWRGRPMPLQLDHVNGRRHDNRLENLRILCPNCHAQTDTWCGKNRRSVRQREAPR